MSTLVRALMFALTLLAGPALAAGSVTVDDLASQIEAGTAPLIIDVRSEDEFLAGHVPGARLIPHDQMGDYLGDLAALKDEPLVLYCRSGARAGRAAEVLESSGFSQVLILEGSYQAWSGAGREVAQ